jgi:hypothetical protein
MEIRTEKNTMEVSWRRKGAADRDKSACIVLEGLEDRRLMSISIAPLQFAVGMPTSTTATTAPAQPKPVAKTPAAVSTEAPNIVGDWKGKLNAKFYLWSQKVGVKLHITDQNDTTIYGSVTILRKTYTGSMDIKFKGNNFSLTFHDGAYRGTLNGFVNKKNTAMAGRASVHGFGLEANGGFLLTRTP